MKIVDDQYYYATKELNRVLDTYKRPLIKEKIQLKHRLEQLYESMRKSIELAEFVYNNYSCLFEYPEPIVRDKYIELCSYRFILGIPELNEIWNKRSIPTDTRPKLLYHLTEPELEKEVDKLLRFSYNENTEK